jgi:amino acid adenylation domain-containing protein
LWAAPLTPTEELLAGLFAEVLELKDVGADADFFALGGHSLLATQLMSRVRAVFGLELPLRVLFEQPRVAGLAQEIEAASRLGRGLAVPPLTRVDRNGEIPLSFAQQRLWFIDQLEPGSTAYNMPMPLRIEGALDVGVLARVLDAVVARHEALRTRFLIFEGKPVQMIDPPAPQPLPVIDLRALPEAGLQAEARRLVSEEISRPFDLARGPLLRTSLLHLASDVWAALFTMHHVVSDGWSLGVLVREVTALYPAFSAGQPSPLPELPVQYADFAAWQRAWLSGEVLEAELAFWRERLAGAPPVLDLPIDRPRPAVKSSRGAVCDLSLPRSLSTGLAAFSRRHGATLFMTLLAAYQALLARICGQSDVSVGTPIAGRNRLETEGLIGFFVNTLVLRAELGQAGSFAELLALVRRETLDAFAHQDLPFEKLVEELSPERSLAHTPLFQAAFVLQNAPMGDLALSHLRLTPLVVEERATKFDLDLMFVEGTAGLAGNLAYASDLFDRATIDRLGGHLERLLGSVMRHPELPLAELPLLAEAERHQLLLEWNDTAVSETADVAGLRLHQLVEAQVRRTPGAPAVVFANEILTFTELEARANRLARRLRALGCGPESRVAVALERSPDLVVALLAALKTGGAYVPCDPDYPAERLAYMLSDARPAVLVTVESLRAALPVPAGLVTLCLDAERDALAGESDEPLAIPGDDRGLAYMIYTSGSTGRPKGAMVHHRGIRNRLLWMQKAYRLTPADTVLQKTPFSFDVSVWEFFWPLLTGARLLLAPPGSHRAAASMVELIEREQVTVVHFVPSMLQIFLDEPALTDGGCPSLRLVIASGEALPPALVPRFHTRLGAELDNLYGPTEASVDVTVWHCRRGGMQATVPIGRPIANTRIHLLDPAGRPLPIGVAGELHIGGVNVGRGYLDRPDLTAERFGPDAFAGEPGARLYHTGDLARLLADGVIEFLGRLDHQVKIRGFRIELGEIEATLCEHPQVREAVVLVQDYAHGDRRLVAHVTAAQDGVQVDDLRLFLSGKLPGYMVPAAFAFHEMLPLNANGKIDRNALGRQRLGELAVKRGVAPRDEVELQLVRACEEVLGIADVGVTDNFFDLGGHSLLAVRLLAQIEEIFGRRISLTTLFQGPTIEQLAMVLRAGAQEEQRKPIVVAIQPRGARLPFFCVHAVGGTVFSFLDLARRLGPEQPFYGLQSPDLSVMAETVEEMAASYIDAIRQVQPAGPYALGGWSMGAVVAFEMARQLHGRGETVELVAMIDAPQPPGGRADSADGAELLAGFARDLTGRDLPLPIVELRRLEPGEQLARVLDLARETGALPASSSGSQLTDLFETFRRNLGALATFRPGVFAGAVEWFRASATQAQEPETGWTDFVTGGLTICSIPGDHYSILRSPHVEELALRLRQAIERRGLPAAKELEAASS